MQVGNRSEEVSKDQKLSSDGAKHYMCEGESTQQKLRNNKTETPQPSTFS